MILSTGWRTDIPAFYSDWFYNRVRLGYVLQRRADNKCDRIPINPYDVDVMTFCSKDYSKFLEHIDQLRMFRCYYYYSITPYGNDLEEYVPSVEESIDTFKQLSNKVGKNKVCWRFDPILITEKYSIEYVTKMFQHIASKLSGYTDKCIFSFVHEYAKTRKNCPDIIHIDDNQKIDIINKMLSICSQYGITLQTCGHSMNWLDKCPGLKKSACVDAETFEEVFNIKFEDNIKQGNLRSGCGCMQQVNIGDYDTCVHNCKYCYATKNYDIALRNYKMHDKNNPSIVPVDTTKTEICYKKYKSNLIDTSAGLF